jgi:DNA-binding GntR family transcriptional regulator
MVERRKGFRHLCAAAAGPRVWLVQSQEGFFGDEARLGRDVTSQIVRREVVVWSTAGARARAGESWSHRRAPARRRRQGHAEVTDWLPADLATVLEMGANDSLYARLDAEYRLTVAGGRRFLAAVEAGDRLARLLETEGGAPLAFIESVSCNAELCPVHCYR